MHCHNEWDLPSALGLAAAVAPIKPLWLEDPLPVLCSDTWREFRRCSPVRMMTGEKLEHPAEFFQFLTNGAVHALHPDSASVSGMTGGRKIADLAELFYVSVVTHQCGSVVQLIATAHSGASVRNSVMAESRSSNDKGLDPEMIAEDLTVKNGKRPLLNGPALGSTIRPGVMDTITANGRWP